MRIVISIVTGVVLTCLLVATYKLIIDRQQKGSRLIPKAKNDRTFDVKLVFEISANGPDNNYPNQFLLQREIQELKARCDYLSTSDSVYFTNDHKIIVQLKNVQARDTPLLLNSFRSVPLSVGFWEIYTMAELEPLIKALYRVRTKEMDATHSSHEVIELARPYVDVSGASTFPAELGYVQGQDTDAVKKLLSIDSVVRFIPSDAVLLFGSRRPSPKFFSIYALRSKSNEAWLSEKDIKRAAIGYIHNNTASINLEFNIAGSHKWEQLTAKNVHRFLAITINNFVISAPSVLSPITGGQTTLEGILTLEEARSMVLQMNSGHLPFPVSLLYKEVKESRHSIFEKYKIVLVVISLILFTLLSYFALPLAMPFSGKKL
jgi:preprotein translocase subunit SecD